MKQADWAERKAWAIVKRRGYYAVADLANALRAERARAVRVCNKTKRHGEYRIPYYNQACDDCAAAIGGGR